MAVAFAQMFYTLLQVDCTGAVAVTTVCTVRDAYRVVYMLLLGEPLVDTTGQDQMSFGAILLIAFFALFLILFLLSLLFTVFIAASHLDFDSISLGSFWEPKLATFFSAEDIVGLSDKGTPGQGSSAGVSSLYSKLDGVWDLLAASLVGGQSRHRKHWHALPDSKFASVLLWIAAVVVLPIWFVVGAITLGSLWPPQLRRFVFRPMGYCAVSSRRTKNSAEQAAMQVTQMRNDIAELKMLSFERSGDLEREFQGLKGLLYAATKKD